MTIEINEGVLVYLYDLVVRVFWLLWDTLVGLNLSATPNWALAAGGVVFVWVIFTLVLPSKHRGRRFSWNRQRKQSMKRHKNWKTEALATLKTIQSSSARDVEIQQQLQAMSPFAFEYLITEGLQKKGVGIRKLKRVTGDGGIDGMLHLQGRWHIVQAKRYAAPVSQGMINEFLALCQRKKMPGLFVATGGFSQPAKTLADRTARITLVDTGQLLAMLR